jgi:hypothetical protein
MAVVLGALAMGARAQNAVAYVLSPHTSSSRPTHTYLPHGIPAITLSHDPY